MFQLIFSVLSLQRPSASPPRTLQPKIRLPLHMMSRREYQPEASSSFTSDFDSKISQPAYRERSPLDKMKPLCETAPCRLSTAKIYTVGIDFPEYRLRAHPLAPLNPVFQSFSGIECSIRPKISITHNVLLIMYYNSHICPAEPDPIVPLLYFFCQSSVLRSSRRKNDMQETTIRDQSQDYR